MKTGVMAAPLVASGIAVLILALGPTPRPTERAPALDLSLAFESNRGQADPRTRFLARGHGFSLSLRPREAALSLDGTMVRMRVVNGNPAARLVPRERLPGKVSYLLGDDRSRWLRGIETYARISVPEVYPGIDLGYYGRRGRLEYDFVVHPGADPAGISLAFEGAQKARVEPSGALVLELPDGTLRQPSPRVYQDVGGERRRVAGRFLLRGDRVAFALGAYDRSRTLVIDPVLDYSTYLGGTGDDGAFAIAVDAGGAAYLTGETYSPDFPGLGGVQPSNAGAPDAFVTKFDAAGALVYSTYLGGTGDELARAIAVDGAGSAHVTGYTSSTDFPTANGSQSGLAGEADAFVTKLTADGTGLAYSTYLGGTDEELGHGIALDGTGEAYVGGVTASADFPTVSPAQAAIAGGVDAFVTKLAPDGALAYSTYLGGTDDDVGHGIAVDATESAHVAGVTVSTDFPTANPAQGSNAGGADGFVTTLAPGGALASSTYLGGTGDDAAYAIAADSAGASFVSGETDSADLPTLNAFQPALAGATDAFVTSFDAGGVLAYSTYLGGSGIDLGHAIATDGTGGVYVTGETDSSNFPVQSAAQAANAGGADAFATKLDVAGLLAHSTYLGGSSDDYGNGVAVDTLGAVYVGGSTDSADFPAVDAAQPSNAGNADVFVAKLGQDQATAVSVLSFSAHRSQRGIRLSWRTGAAHGLLGFNLFAERRGSRVPVNRGLIAPAARQGYSFRTTLRSTRYWLQEVRVDGSRRWYGPVAPR